MNDQHKTESVTYPVVGAPPVLRGSLAINPPSIDTANLADDPELGRFDE